MAAIWLREEWNNPSRSDYYQMQTANEVRRVLVERQHKGKFRADELKIPFAFEKRTGKAKKTKTMTERTAASKSRWAKLGARIPTDE